MMLSAKNRKNILTACIILSAIVLTILYYFTSPVAPSAIPPAQPPEFIDGKNLQEPVLEPLKTDSEVLSKS
jgi:hypothetical protein